MSVTTGAARTGFEFDLTAGENEPTEVVVPGASSRTRRRAAAPHAGSFKLGELLGRGGMGDVLLARDSRLCRDVAVKLMRGSVHADAVKRFVREARIQALLDHPAVVPVYDLGVDDRGAPYFAMKRLNGITLHDVIARLANGEAEAQGRWPRRRLLAALVDVCLAVELAHTRGVIHRDLKPANIMLGDFGEVYVLDWGIARLVGPDGVTDRAITSSDVGALAVAETVAGAQVGTPGYMAPEQVRGEPADQRCDVYALGCVLFELLTGRPALRRGPAMLAATLAAPAWHPRLRCPDLDVPPELDELCAAATAPDPTARLATARDLATGIQRYLDGDRDLARRGELAAEYATSAQQAVEEDREQAMLDAGRALALDPDNRVALGVVGRLLLSPPVAPPAEVERALEQETIRSGRVQLRTAVAVYCAFLLAMPALLWFAQRPEWVFALTAGIGANLAAFVYVSERDRPVGRWLYAGLVLHCGTLALAGFVLGPLVIIPAVAVGSIAAFMSNPMVTRPLLVFGAHVVAVFAPIYLELADVVPRTFSFGTDGLHLHPWAVNMSPRVMLIVTLVGTLLQLVVTTTLVLQLRRTKDGAERQTFLHVWHLRSLVPRRQDVACARDLA